jgi:hypothetical protein
VNPLREKARFKSTLSEIFEAFSSRTEPSVTPAFIGATYRDPLEHTTRKYVIDEILSSLGWNLGRLTREMVEEARLQGDSTLFLDYLGINPTQGVPLAIVEAKAWAKPFVTASDVGAAGAVRGNPSSVETLLALATEHCKSGGKPEESPIAPEWAKWIAKLHQYVTTLHTQSGHTVQRVAITAGRWWIIFTAPYDSFIAQGLVNTKDILAFDSDEVIARSDEVFSLLARQSLIADPPSPVAPTQISAYADRASVARVYHALWIARRKDGAHFDAFPQINVYPSIVVERHDGQMIYIVDQLRGRITVPHNYDGLASHIDEVGQRATELLQVVNDELSAALQPSPITAFTGFQIPNTLAATLNLDLNGKFLKSWPSPNEFLLITGVEKHFLLPYPSVDPCAGHAWGECHALHVNQRSAPIVNRSFEPASFFTTIEPHHCAHRTVHDRRAARCHISPFEEFLCCRACVFQKVCWAPEELGRLPCGLVATPLQPQNAAA